MNEMHDLIVTRGVKFSGVERLENVLNTALKLADAQDALRANARNVAKTSILPPTESERKYASTLGR
jgi:hypothetical protein